MDNVILLELNAGIITVLGGNPDIKVYILDWDTGGDPESYTSEVLEEMTEREVKDYIDITIKERQDLD